VNGSEELQARLLVVADAVADGRYADVDQLLAELDNREFATALGLLASLGIAALLPARVAVGRLEARVQLAKRLQAEMTRRVPGIPIDGDAA
jgi:hypothetical protein